ncbi:GNAT family N-acetyltransferase [Salipaludibacillus keqinensis]|uniref:GNAT family N-acetyltransferase n=1 Tax=Salipaludibacillus keqinensis TaxID=2045207 RepID=A0A323TJ01_9BACI|nr:GNAT family N-acetyltransferase [Salipaludibacillus keqinensis]PYZ94699.1 GNAT family N-acetyltransferase [Salipaludibacillus keqinensis]
MNKTIRPLTTDDYPLFEAMDTGIDGDYIKLYFNRFASGANKLYGLFVDGKLASMGGYSIFAGRYAMLGRLRSDRRFQGKSLATELMTHVRQEASEVEGIQWVGANTEEHNQPARRVLEKIGLTSTVIQHAAIAKDVTALEHRRKVWQEVDSFERKKVWLEKVYLRDKNVFPYQCYYTFPASEALFENEQIDRWTFYENHTQNRVVIVKHDQKRTHYLHMAYPWSDFAEQEGLWETVSMAREDLEDRLGEETYVWFDVPKEEATMLPEHHPFQLNSIWVLYEAK